MVLWVLGALPEGADLPVGGTVLVVPGIHAGDAVYRLNMPAVVITDRMGSDYDNDYQHTLQWRQIQGTY
jgi:hypothetical protein